MEAYAVLKPLQRPVGPIVVVSAVLASFAATGCMGSVGEPAPGGQITYEAGLVPAMGMGCQVPVDSDQMATP